MDDVILMGNRERRLRPAHLRDSRPGRTVGNTNNIVLHAEHDHLRPPTVCLQPIDLAGELTEVKNRLRFTKMESQLSNEKKRANEETTHIDFYQAMRDFKIMFPLMDDDVIEEILRANRGAVDATIDQLLAMSTDNLNETLRHNLERDETSSADVIRFSEPPDVTKNGITSHARRKWSPPLLGPLPPTFLRIAPVEQKPHSDCHEDERIAFFLQNEEFLSELRANQDFLSTLDTDIEEKGSTVSDAELFKERLRNMGKVSRSKFAQLSRVFQRRKKNRSVKGILDQTSSGDSMLLGGEPLLSDGQDEPVRKG